MSQSATLETDSGTVTEHFDVMVVGAGISGIGSAVHLQEQCPGKSFVILEKFESFGGTWHMHRYPGVRSDSDLYTFGYRFKPWVGPPIATAEEIKKYMGEVIEEHDLAPHIRYRHRITAASWSSETNRWTVRVSRLDKGDEVTLTCGFLYMCQGYYNQDKGYMPDWPGLDSYRGRIIHPMEWTDDVDYADKNILVIGSGATAATVVPALSKNARHVTVLQRSPTYFIPGRNADDLADTLRQLEIDEKWIHEIVRRKRLFDGKAVTEMSFQQPEELRTFLLEGVKALLPEGFDMKHFTPKYRPWQQRIAFVPDGDLFEGIREGRTTMVTDEIETFTETGVVTKDGTRIEADIVVPATGFNLSVLGDIPFEVDGRPVSWPDTVTYRGMMFTSVPNLAWIFGYFRASWTLRVDLMGDFIGRLFALMDRKGARKVTPRLRPEDAGMEIGDWIRPDNFNPNYLMRSIDQMPKSGDKPEWKHDQDYWAEKDLIPKADLEDGCLVFE